MSGLWPNSVDRLAVFDMVKAANGGVFPDMEGLIRDIYVAYLQPGDVALDVGVNHGGHLIQMAETVGDTGKVIGVEAVPDLVQRTREQIAQHYSHVESRVLIHNLAVSDKPGRAKFYFSRMNDSGLSGMANRAILQDAPVDEIEVQVETVDNLLSPQDLSGLRFAKFDIEGAEYHAFKGATQALKQLDAFTFEWDPSAPEYFNYEPAEIYNFVREQGFQIFDLFGFGYDEAKTFTSSPMWNFVALRRSADPRAVLEPSIRTLKQGYPQVDAWRELA